MNYKIISISSSKRINLYVPPTDFSIYSKFFYSYIHSNDFSKEVLDIVSTVLDENDLKFETLFPKKEGSILLWGSVLYAIPYIKKYGLLLQNFIDSITDIDVVILCPMDSCKEPIKTAVKHYLNSNLRYDSYEYAFLSNLFFDVIASTNGFNSFLTYESMEWEFMKRMILQPVLIFGEIDSFISLLKSLEKRYIANPSQFANKLSSSLIALDFIRIKMIQKGNFKAPFWKKKTKLHNLFDFDSELKLLGARGKKYKYKTKKWLSRIEPNLKYFSERRGFCERISKEVWQKWRNAL